MLTSEAIVNKSDPRMTQNISFIVAQISAHVCKICIDRLNVIFCLRTLFFYLFTPCVVCTILLHT